LKLNNEEPLSNFAFNFNLRRYTKDLSNPTLDFDVCCAWGLRLAAEFKVQAATESDWTATGGASAPGAGESSGRAGWMLLALS